MKPNIALLATGGTIASMKSERGLIPGMNAAEIIKNSGRISEIADVVPVDVFNLDSSNVQPEEWQLLAQAVRNISDSVDGIVITHGTDTMAYTASALSFMLYDIDKPIVLTGSQLPMNFPFSDAAVNLEEAFSFASKAKSGVYVVFHHKVIFGTRAVKMRTLSYDAFDSINLPPFAIFNAEGLRLSKQSLPSWSEKLNIINPDLIDSKVFLLKLIPGTNPEIFDCLVNSGYKGVVIEAFGLGGIHYMRRNLIDKLNLLSDLNIPVLVRTQCPYERSNFSIYEVGHDVIQAQNVFPAHDMTTEAAITKLMWVLGDLSSRKNYLSNNLCNEISIQ